MKQSLLALGMLALVTSSPGAHASKADAGNKAVIRRLVEAFNSGNLAGYDELLAPDFAAHSTGPGPNRGREEYKQSLVSLRTAFPDARITIEDVIAEGNKVVLRHTLTGTHRGTLKSPGLGDLPATGKRFTITGIVIYRLTGGRVVERWSNLDDLGMLTQLGVFTLSLKPTQ